jgi:hypothetical protein
LSPVSATDRCSGRFDIRPILSPMVIVGLMRYYDVHLKIAAQRRGFSGDRWPAIRSAYCVSRSKHRPLGAHAH